MKKTALLCILSALICLLTGCMSRTPTREEVDALTFGYVTDGVYENSTFAIGFVTPDGWSCETQEEIYQRNGWDATKDIGEQMKKAQSKNAYHYELQAVRDDGNATVTVIIENMAILDTPDSSEVTYAATNILTTKEHFEELSEELGVTAVKVEPTTAQVAGSEHAGYQVSCRERDTELFYKAIYIKQGIYTACITVSSRGEDVTDQLLSMFEAL